MSPSWKQVERRGVCHYPDVSSENIYVVSVDDLPTIEYFVRWHPLWPEPAEHYKGKTWFVVVFDELSPGPFRWASSGPFATLDEAVRYAEEKLPTGMVWTLPRTQRNKLLPRSRHRMPQLSAARLVSSICDLRFLIGRRDGGGGGLAPVFTMARLREGGYDAVNMMRYVC
jgi:hypothetical protein